MRDGNALRRQHHNYDPAQIRAILDADEPIAIATPMPPKPKVDVLQLPSWRLKPMPPGRRKPRIAGARFDGD